MTVLSAAVRSATAQRAARTEARFVYRHLEQDAVSTVWRALKPQDIIVAREWQGYGCDIPLVPVIVPPDNALTASHGVRAIT